MATRQVKPWLATGNLVELSHALLAQVVQEGDVVVDATCGRGRDTLFLAQLVGPTGWVHAFDIQKEACRLTQELCENQQQAQRLLCHPKSHVYLKEEVTSAKAVLFNLGYLPGGDTTCMTQSTTTIKALSIACDILTRGGICLALCYPGHAGGDLETTEVAAFFAGLSGNIWQTGAYTIPNRPKAPCLFYAWKLKEEKKSEKSQT